ncbi:hypothetical protein K2X85_04435 [bacterium]|nr:hypothetical protein [bacterium]
MSRFQAPREDRKTLAYPDWALWPEMIRESSRRPPSSAIMLAGESIANVRQSARQDLFDLAKAYAKQTGEPVAPFSNGPLIVTGHQPELFHPGVWIKSFAADSLAKRVEGSAVHVVIDNDIMKTSAIRVPAGGPQKFVVGHVPFDQWAGEIPYEERNVVDESIFREFVDRVQVTMSKLPFLPIAETFWKEALRQASRTANIGERFSAARRRLERDWGLHQAEVPLSWLCQTDSFLRLFIEIARQGDVFRDLYNSALRQYREKYKVRSRHHPASDLGAASSAIELPFWVWRSDRPERQPLWVRPSESQLSFFGGRPGESGPSNHHVADISSSAAPEEILSSLNGWKIRPRALVTTLYLRGIVGDGFIHGIGGGKYDEVTDRLLTDFLGWPQPPAMGVVSGTLYLPFHEQVDWLSQIGQARRRSRDAFWNPDRYLSDALREREPIAGWIEEKQHLQSSPAARLQAWTREDWIHFRTINDRLRPYVQAARQEADRQVDLLMDEERSLRAVRSRDYSFCLHPADSLESFLHLLD